ncbi:MAG: hypothetical protein PW734_03380 [Verrucomicrobium sp.]|nr:hypothetical protein [Verrucomicrobium sp.]
MSQPSLTTEIAGTLGKAVLAEVPVAGRGFEGLAALNNFRHAYQDFQHGDKGHAAMELLEGGLRARAAITGRAAGKTELLVGILNVAEDRVFTTKAQDAARGRAPRYGNVPFQFANPLQALTSALENRIPGLEQ